ncbi:hypothetical protein [Ferrimicrobium sp.]|nr:hypothetical protein [Ferrimicrobium sp.]
MMGALVEDECVLLGKSPHRVTGLWGQIRRALTYRPGRTCVVVDGSM